MSITPTEEQIDKALELIRHDETKAAWLYAQAMNRLHYAERALSAVRCLSQNPSIVIDGSLKDIGFAFGREIKV